MWFFRTAAFTSLNSFLIHWGVYTTLSATGFLTLGIQGGISNYWWNNALGSDLNCASSNCPLFNNTWYHLVATYDGTVHKIYLNGTLKVQRTPSVVKATVRANFFIGYVGTNEYGFPTWTEKWKGYIDDLGIYNRALTVTEVQTIYNSSILPPTPATISEQIAIVSSQISTLNQEMNNIKSTNSDILFEISKMKLSIQKIIATLTRLRKTNRSKKVEL